MSKIDYQVAGPALARLSRHAHEAGLFRIRAELKSKGDRKGLSREHKAHFEERAAAITYVEHTGKPAMGILEKYKCVDIEASGGVAA